MTCGTRTRSSINCTSRRSPTATMTASATSPASPQQLDYLQDLGVNTLWLLPFYPSPGKDDGYDIADYRRINPDFGTLRDFKPLHDRSASARPSRHHRAGDQSHLGPAPLVQARAPKRPDHRRAQLVRLERQRPEVLRHPHHFHRHREVELDLGSGGRRLLLAPLLLAPARPQFRQSARALGHRPGDAALARHGRRRFPARRDSLSVRARRHQQREPPRDPRRHQADPRGARRLQRRASCCSPKPTSGRRTSAPISATATNATWPITFR